MPTWGCVPALGPQIAFDIYLGIIVFVSMVGYMGVTIWITEWRTRFRRASNDADNDARQKGAAITSRAPRRSRPARMCPNVGNSPTRESRGGVGRLGGMGCSGRLAAQL